LSKTKKVTQAGKCEACGADDVRFAGVLALEPLRRVCRRCLDNPAIPTIEGDYCEVTIPACYRHHGVRSVTVILRWRCPKCGGPRGPVVPGCSLDGSRTLQCDDWHNRCGHEDFYWAARKEAAANGLNSHVVLPAPPRYL
jgi:hypothetical protein